jgi:hypothetical protein
MTQALMAAEADDFYRALKLIRRVLAHESAVLGTTHEQRNSAGDEGERRNDGSRRDTTAATWTT